MARCVVTGGAGFIGSTVVDLLLKHGHQVLVVDDFSTGDVDNLNPGAKVIQASILDKHLWSFLLESHPAEYVFHLAALARIQPSIQDPISSHNVNVDGTLEVLEYCRASGAKLIFSSSSSIYKGDDLPTSEISPKHPKSPYAMQKLICEQYIRLYRELYGLDYAILRYFNVFGERQILIGAYAAVVGILLDAKSRGEDLPITNDGEQKRDFTYVGDVARANLLAMGWQGTFNIGTGENRSINQLADRIGGEKEYIGERQGEARATLADNTKALAKGWLPTTNIMEWIDATLER